MQATLKAMFDEDSYPILVANKGEEALGILGGRQDRMIILLDSDMPGLDGEGV